MIFATILFLGFLIINFSFELGCAIDVAECYDSVECWSFNGNANNEIGNGNNGHTVLVSTSTNRFGVSDSSFRFNGKNSYIELMNNHAGNSTNSSFEVTVVSWIKILNLTDNGIKNVFVKYRDGSFNTSEYGLMHDEDGRIMFGREVREVNGLKFEGFKTEEALPVGCWHFVVGTYSDNWRVYVNGSLIGSKVVKYNISNPQNEGNWFVGGNAEGKYFNGLVDDVRIFNRSLREREIMDIFENELERGDLVAFYNLDGNVKDDVCKKEGFVRGGWFGEDRLGKKNSSYLFNNDRGEDKAVLSIPSSRVLDFGFGDFSLSFWILFNELRRRDFIFGSLHPLWFNMLLEKNPDQKRRIVLRIDENGDHPWEEEVRGVKDTWECKKWYLVCVVREGNYVNVFVDGVLDIRLFTSVTFYHTSNGLHFGRSSTNWRSGSDSLLGKIDEIRIYHRSINESEMLGIHGGYADVGVMCNSFDNDDERWGLEFFIFDNFLLFLSLVGVSVSLFTIFSIVIILLLGGFLFSHVASFISFNRSVKKESKTEDAKPESHRRCRYWLYKFDKLKNGDVLYVGKCPGKKWIILALYKNGYYRKKIMDFSSKKGTPVNMILGKYIFKEKSKKIVVVPKFFNIYCENVCEKKPKFLKKIPDSSVLNLSYEMDKIEGIVSFSFEKEFYRLRLCKETYFQNCEETEKV